MYTVGMEEEYFVFDAQTRHAVRRSNKKFLARAQKQLGDRVMTEMLQSQIEVATPPCASMKEAREHLTHYRRTLGQAAAEHKLGLAAMGTFPLAYWPEQMVTRKARYGPIMDDLQMIGYRNMLCGMHVHVAVPDIDTRINLIMRLTAVPSAAARAVDVVAILARPPDRSRRATGLRLTMSCRAPGCPNSFAPMTTTANSSRR